MALVHDNIAPCHHPNKFALANVIRKAGNGAAIDCNIINIKDIAIA